MLKTGKIGVLEVVSMRWSRGEGRKNRVKLVSFIIIKQTFDVF